MANQSGSDPDVVLVHNAKLYSSGEDDYTWMTFNKKTGNIIRRGRRDPPMDQSTPDNAIDARSRRILPGLQDSHIHLFSYAEQLWGVDLFDCSSIDELKNRLTDYIVKNADKPLEWIVGYKWEQDKLGRFPTKDDLDEVCRDKPMAIFRICIHTVVVNTKGLEVMGLDKNTTGLPSGMLCEVYPKGHLQAGELNGSLQEAVDYINVNYLEPPRATKVEMLKVGIQRCLEYGITCVHSLERNTWDAFCDLADADELPLRVFYAAYYSYRDKEFFPKPKESRGPMLHCDRIKLFSDGALGPCTAAVSQAYKGTDNKGLLVHKQEELTELVGHATARGYRLEIHGIGDAGADAMVTALEQADVAPEKRPILVHCQILRKDLIERMKVQGVIGSLQPQFVLTDSRWLDDLLPDELSHYLYPWKSLLDAGVACCGGSDAPVESPEPLIGIYDAIFRPADKRGPDNKKCFKPEEKLTVTEAIDLYTKAGAYTAMREDSLGQLRPGFQADFVVLDSSRDPCEHPEEFCRAKPAQVWVAGDRKL